MTDPTPIPHLNVPGSTPPPAAGISNAHNNPFLNFFKKIGHGIVDVFIWAPKVGAKTVQIIEEVEDLTPEFKTALGVLVSDGAAIAAVASEAVVAKGADIMKDAQVLAAVETFIKNFGTYYTALYSEWEKLEGVTLTSVEQADVAKVTTETAKFAQKTPAINTSEGTVPVADGAK